MTGGELLEYICAYPSADRLSLVSSGGVLLENTLTPCQLSDVADGLVYLHSHGIVHGDLKGVRKMGKCSRNLLTCVSVKHPRG
jgi:serine/threonine protein kinase